jgi:hypothetical protein
MKIIFRNQNSSRTFEQSANPLKGITAEIFSTHSFKWSRNESEMIEDTGDFWSHFFGFTWQLFFARNPGMRPSQLHSLHYADANESEILLNTQFYRNLKSCSVYRQFRTFKPQSKYSLAFYCPSTSFDDSTIAVIYFISKILISWFRTYWRTFHCKSGLVYIATIAPVRSAIKSEIMRILKSISQTLIFLFFRKGLFIQNYIYKLLVCLELI